MELPANAINWFEIAVSDFNRAKKFYSTIYAYDMPEMDMGPAKMGILLYDNMKGVGGAIVKMEGHNPSLDGTRVYLNGGEDLNVVLNRVEGAGGKIIAAKTEVAPGMGFWAAFEDTEGNYVCLHSMK